MEAKVTNQDSFLKRFHMCQNICVQCHDNPDADALASGYALYQYFKEAGIQVQLIYGGKNEITKPNLRLMVSELEIPIQHIDTLPECDLLITTDCQYGSGNVTRFEAPRVAMIDHHQCGFKPDDDCCIRSNLGSCSTVVWDLLTKEGMDVNKNGKLATALYYGLYSDTNCFDEVYHPLDRDMRDSLKRDDILLFQLMNTNLSLEELNITSKALREQKYFSTYRFSVIPTEQCDPNILGIISDFIIQVEKVDTCVAFNLNPNGYKLSVRSCIREVKANELAEELCKDIGNGGGHVTKAGGFIAQNMLDKKYPHADMEQLLVDRMKEYYDSYDIIYAESHVMDKSDMKRYRKKAVRVGFVKALDLLPADTPVIIRALEGDVDLVIRQGLYFMVGVEGEVYPIEQKKFESSYKLADGSPDLMEMDYEPTIHDTIHGRVYSLTEHMQTCVSTGETHIYARKLTKNVKIFTSWDRNKYYRGLVGDYIAVREDDPHDIYIVRGDIFNRTYEEIQ